MVRIIEKERQLSEHRAQSVPGVENCQGRVAARNPGLERMCQDIKSRLRGHGTREGGEQFRVHDGDAGNERRAPQALLYAAGLVAEDGGLTGLRAGAGGGGYADDGERVVRGRLIVAQQCCKVRAGHRCGDRLRGIQRTAAADADDGSSACTEALRSGGVDFRNSRIRRDAGEDAGALFTQCGQQFIKMPGARGAALTGDDEDVIGEGNQLPGFTDDAVTEDNPGGTGKGKLPRVHARSFRLTDSRWSRSPCRRAGA